MTLTTDQVLALAPDAASAAAGRALATAGTWRNLGRSETALWGECQGSALYQVRVDLAGLTTRCGCPSRKFPCKHGLGLLLLAADTLDALPLASPPDWVADWLAKRTGASGTRQTAQRGDAATAQQAKRAEKRQALVRQGMDGLNLWLADLVRNGLAGLEMRPTTFWEQQAARLVDAQAPGLAARVRRLSALPGSSPQWPRHLLEALGRLALLSEAYRHLESQDPALQADVRGLIGWTLKEDEVVAHGDLVRDIWFVLGQWIEDEDRGRVQRTWMLGRNSGRAALVLQFSFAGAPFAPAPIPGASLEATLAYWPSACPLRALIHERAAMHMAGQDRPTGVTTIDAFLGGVARALALSPWLERFPCLLGDVRPAPTPAGAWQVYDAAGDALPLVPGDHWRLLAISGGEPLDLAAEWDGRALRPLGALVGDRYHSLWEGR